MYAVVGRLESCFRKFMLLALVRENVNVLGTKGESVFSRGGLVWRNLESEIRTEIFAIEGGTLLVCSASV